MYKVTKVGLFNGNLVKRREWVRNRRVVAAPGKPGGTVLKEFYGHEYLVFIGVDADETTCYGHQTRSFGNKAEAIRYAKNTKPINKLEYSVCAAS